MTKLQSFYFDARVVRKPSKIKKMMKAKKPLPNLDQPKKYSSIHCYAESYREARITMIKWLNGIGFRVLEIGPTKPLETDEDDE